MRKTLIINSGSSSLKYTLFTMPNFEVDCEGLIERIGIDGAFNLKFSGEKIEIKQEISNHEQAIELLLQQLEKYNLIDNKDQITKIGHRVVQGGEIFKKSTVVNEKELKQIYDLAKLAPLHNGANADGIKVFQKLLPDAINVAVFDTEFHQSMPKESYIYPVPYSWYEDYSVRRYGMHGTSHKFVSNKVAEFENKPLEELKIINCHLGNGASLSAVKDGKVLTTSMGLTPLAGIMMGTRCGDIDPSIINYMSEQTGKSLEEITNSLNKESGLLGISGISSDCRDVEVAMEAGNEQAKFTFDLYTTRLIETIGSMAARMGGLDIITFTGGIGENADYIRKLTLEGLSIFNVEIDNAANEDRSLGGNRIITKPSSGVKSWIITTNEEYQIALEAEQF